MQEVFKVNMNQFDFQSNLLKEKRRQLIDSLRKKCELNQTVLDAMEQIPRELFVSPALAARSYEDNALPIECGQTISQPYTVAYQTTLLDVHKGDKILEIGTGSGYQSALLYVLGAKVFSIERFAELNEQAKKIFRLLNLSINTRVGDGTIGWREFSPYDCIIITAAAPEVPQSLLEQLTIGGRMVVPVGDRDSQVMHLMVRVAQDEYEEIKRDRFKFVPLIGKEGWQNNG
jgi:protein-L-isoaspartate(D-aspartate) O-methyltransferase